MERLYVDLWIIDENRKETVIRVFKDSIAAYQEHFHGVSDWTKVHLNGGYSFIAKYSFEQLTKLISGV